MLPVSTSSLADMDIIKGASGVDKDFQRKAEEMPRPLTEAPYYAIEVEPVIHHTMGGIKINSKAEVVDRSGKVELSPIRLDISLNIACSRSRRTCCGLFSIVFCGCRRVFD